MTTRIHVNSQNVKNNPKNLPVFVATDETGHQRHGHFVEIRGPSVLRYSPDDPLPGDYEAVAYIETQSEVKVFTKTGGTAHAGWLREVT